MKNYFTNVSVVAVAPNHPFARRRSHSTYRRGAAEPFIGSDARGLSSLLRLSFDHLCEGETKAARGRGA